MRDWKSTVPLGLFIASALLALLSAQLHAGTAGQVFDKVKDSVAVVKTLDRAGKEKGLGSGVLLPSGKIATNCHVVAEGASYRVGWGEQFVPATLYAEDYDKDICLLDAKVVGRKPVELGKAATLKVGDRVYAVGAPHGLELSLSDGLVAQLWGGPPPIIQTTAAISPGSSGGGLFDSQGRLAGLTTLYLEGGQSLNFAMPVEWIAEVKPGRKEVSGEYGLSEWLMRAVTLEESEDWQGMLDWCRRWTKSEPKNADAWYNLGVAYGRDPKRYQDAIDAYRQAIRINPEHADTWNNLVVSYALSGNRGAAMDALQELRRLDPARADRLFDTLVPR